MSADRGSHVKVHEAIAAVLREQGVDTVFGLVGDANLYMMDAFRREGGRFVAVANETGALLAAAGHQAISGRTGVASVTHGPGLANTVTSLYETVKHRVPAVLIAGDTAVTDTDNFQDIDQRALVVATGAQFVQARTPESTADDLRRAFALAASGRIPVVFNVPIDFQWIDAAFTAREAPAAAVARLAPDPAQIEDALAVIASAKRPLVLAGRGAIGARDDALRLAGRIGAPVATTAQARQLFAGEPFDLGIFGGLATPESLAAITESDCLVVLGASLNRWTTENGALTTGRRVVHIDDDALALGRHVLPAAPVHADAGLAAQAMIDLLDEADVPRSGFASEDLRVRLERARADAEVVLDDLRTAERRREADGSRPAGTIDIVLAQRLIERTFPRRRTVVMDAGRQCMTALGIFTVEHPAHYVHTISFGSIGVGVPYAIGAALAEPERPTLLLCGDGGFMLGGLTEFHTAVRHGLDLVVVVFNDGSFGAEHIQLVRKGMDPTISLFDWPDLGQVAESLGGRGVTVRTIAELEEALASLPDGRTVLLNVMVSADEISARG